MSDPGCSDVTLGAYYGNMDKLQLRAEMSGPASSRTVTYTLRALQDADTHDESIPVTLRL